jgi:kinesin family protein 11
MQAHVRAVETTRAVSKITMNFFETIDRHASSLTQIVEETQVVNDQKLSELEKKFEVTVMSFLIDINHDNVFTCFLLLILMFLILYSVQECTAYEEKQLLEKVAEMLASSNARKKKLVDVLFKTCEVYPYLVQRN